MTKAEQHAGICLELNKTYQKKNHDYGDSFADTYQKLGLISAVTRITDKVNRITALCTKRDAERQVLDESIEDTLLDTANYCIMTVMEMRNRGACN